MKLTFGFLDRKITLSLSFWTFLSLIEKELLSYGKKKVFCEVTVTFDQNNLITSMLTPSKFCAIFLRNCPQRCYRCVVSTRMGGKDGPTIRKHEQLCGGCSAAQRKYFDAEYIITIYIYISVSYTHNFWEWTMTFTFSYFTFHCGCLLIL